jgi:uncharacterized protein YndB with AHSA1/START domain
MSILTIILIVVAALLLILLISAAFLKKDYIIEREITINKPVQVVFDYIKPLKNAVTYNKWVMMDPNLKREYSGTDGTVGFVSAWDSENKQVGKGEQEITKIKEGERIDYEIRFEKPFKGTSFAYLVTTPAGNQTNVKWAFLGVRNYAMKIFHLILNLEKALGKDLSTSLTNLKNILEK